MNWKAWYGNLPFSLVRPGGKSLGSPVGSCDFAASQQRTAVLVFETKREAEKTLEVYFSWNEKLKPEKVKLRRA